MYIYILSKRHLERFLGVIGAVRTLDCLRETRDVDADLLKGGLAASQVLVRKAWRAGEDEGEVGVVSEVVFGAGVDAREVLVIRVEDDIGSGKSCRNNGKIFVMKR